MSDRPPIIEIRISRRLLWWVVAIFLAILVLSFVWLALQTLGGRLTCVRIHHLRDTCAGMLFALR